MKHWLLKSEPGVFSLDDLAQAPGRRTEWDGIHNYQARNNLRSMKRGDRAFYYHSNAEPSAIVGTVEIAREAYPDPEDDRWSWVDVRFLSKFKNPVDLQAVKKDPRLKDMVLVKNSRLSVQPVTPAQWALCKKLGGAG